MRDAGRRADGRGAHFSAAPQATGIGPAFGQAGFFKWQAPEQIPLAINRFHAEAKRTLAPRGDPIMTQFATYRDSFPNARLTRSKTGVLEVALHTDGGTLVFNGHTHEQFVDLFHAIGSDPDNRVVILTGSGKAFMESISPEGFDFFSPVGYDKIYREGKKVLMNILDVEVPLIAAVNGPVRLHSEYILLADIVLATPSTVFQDKPHFEFGIVPGDGVNLLWPEVIGSIRGRYFLLTRQELGAETAKEWGAVNEIVPADKLLGRAREIAEGLAKLPPLTTRYTRIALTQKLRRIVDEGVGYSLALEGISAAEVARAAAPGG
jgi:enoyl-CoA hydratase/carnithine racemase